MTKIERMQRQSELARELASARVGVLEGTPFAELLKDTKFDLGRVATPVVAVVGAFSSGKSSLINSFCGARVLPTGTTPTTSLPVQLRGGPKWRATVGGQGGEGPGPASPSELVTLMESPRAAEYAVVEAPEARSVPWAWLDMPGNNVGGESRLGPSNPPAALADYAVLVTSALQPMAMTDLRHAVLLSEQLPGRLCIAVSRCDQLAEDERRRVVEYVERVLRASLGTGAPRVIAFSAKKQPGSSALATRLHEDLCSLQYERLDSEIDGWNLQLADLKKLLRMRELAAVAPSTVRGLRDNLVRVAMGRLAEIRRALPEQAERIAIQLSGALPSTRRALHQAAAGQLAGTVNAALSSLGAELSDLIVHQLRQDISKKGAAEEVVQHVATIWRIGSPSYFAGANAAVGAGLGLVLGAVVPPAGFLIGGLLGGLLGGYLGDGDQVSSEAVVREEIVGPLVRSALAETEGRAGMLRRELEHFCSLMETAIQTYRAPTSETGLKLIETMIPGAATHARHLSSQLADLKNAEPYPREPR